MLLLDRDFLLTASLELFSDERVYNKAQVLAELSYVVDLDKDEKSLHHGNSESVDGELGDVLDNLLFVGALVKPQEGGEGGYQITEMGLELYDRGLEFTWDMFRREYVLPADVRRLKEIARGAKNGNRGCLFGIDAFAWRR